MHESSLHCLHRCEYLFLRELLFNILDFDQTILFHVASSILLDYLGKWFVRT